LLHLDARRAARRLREAGQDAMVLGRLTRDLPGFLRRRDLGGASLLLGSEPMTESRWRSIEASGAQAIVHYGSDQTSSELWLEIDAASMASRGAARRYVQPVRTVTGARLSRVLCSCHASRAACTRGQPASTAE